ncbi:MAG: SDR family NAD(P)-dependent oxidoreductase [Clostridiaceae bacterium]|nr:SDR family NAD(P)-dependent oxidoreductase [Clostridiaceae bacterium]
MQIRENNLKTSSALRVALVTGASSGLGREYAIQLAARRTDTPGREPWFNFTELWLSGRDLVRLTETAQLCVPVPCRLFIGDLIAESNESAGELSRALDNPEIEVAILVNSAGLGFAGRFAAQSKEQISNTVRLNCEALTLSVHRALPRMKSGSAVLNLASSAAFIPQPGFAVYAAAKSYVLSFSRALNAELAESGIRVIAVCPNAVATPFQIRAGVGEIRGIKRLGMERAERVVERSWKALRRNRDVAISHFTARLVRWAGKMPNRRLIKLFNRQ